jgi:hypothetical protein
LQQSSQNQCSKAASLLKVIDNKQEPYHGGETISQVEADHRDMDTSATTKSHHQTTDEYKPCNLVLRFATTLYNQENCKYLVL